MRTAAPGVRKVVDCSDGHTPCRHPRALIRVTGLLTAAGGGHARGCGSRPRLPARARAQLGHGCGGRHRATRRAAGAAPLRTLPGTAVRSRFASDHDCSGAGRVWAHGCARRPWSSRHERDPVDPPPMWWQEHTAKLHRSTWRVVAHSAATGDHEGAPAAGEPAEGRSPTVSPTVSSYWWCPGLRS